MHWQRRLPGEVGRRFFFFCGMQGGHWLKMLRRSFVVGAELKKTPLTAAPRFGRGDQPRKASLWGLKTRPSSWALVRTPPPRHFVSGSAGADPLRSFHLLCCLSCPKPHGRSPAQDSPRPSSWKAAPCCGHPRALRGLAFHSFPRFLGGESSPIGIRYTKEGGAGQGGRRGSEGLRGGTGGLGGGGGGGGSERSKGRHPELGISIPRTAGLQTVAVFHPSCWGLGLQKTRFCVF